MSYTPTEWKTGDIVTADKLNKLENGVASAGGGGSLVCEYDPDNNYALNYTYQQIADAAASGKIVVIAYPEESFANYAYLVSAGVDFEGYYRVRFFDNGSYVNLFTDSPNGYPVDNS